MVVCLASYTTGKSVTLTDLVADYVHDYESSADVRCPPIAVAFATWLLLVTQFWFIERSFYQIVDVVACIYFSLHFLGGRRGEFTFRLDFTLQ